MKIIGITEEDFVNYKSPCMYICLPYCTFKCDKESGGCYCQNSALSQRTPMDVPISLILDKYVSNMITRGICLSGLEPFEQYEDVKELIRMLRQDYQCNDPVIIYTGFNKEEILDYINELSQFENIIVKFGRFIPNDEKRYDDVLGICLASKNQYAEKIS